MKPIKITLRQKEILNKICSEYKYITISSIAESLSISSRTVLRELSDIEKWLVPFNCSLDKRTGIGIRLKGSFEDRKAVVDSLEEENEIKNYTPGERQIIIVSELLQNREPVKIYSFTKLLNVTEGTVSNDLDKIEEWVIKYDLKLIRKPGLGIFLEGQEDSIRRAIINLIYENINESQLIDLIKENIIILDKEYKTLDKDTKNRLLNLIDRNTVRKLESLIYELESALGYRLADNAYVGLLVHLALAIQRIIKDEKIIMDKQYLKELKSYSEYKIAEDLTEKISKTFNIEIPEDEIGYITMHLRGTKGFEPHKNNRDTVEFMSIAKEIIRVAEVQTGSFLEQNEGLLEGLINHLGPAINRVKMKMDIRNPLLDEIKEFYPSLFKLALNCSTVIEERLGIKMPESEIAYIAMHLGAVLEKKQVAQRRVYRAVIACTTGIGTSFLLATRIEREYDNIQIMDVVSTLHLNESYLIEKNIDFIIATVTIKNLGIPVVVVNPLLLEKDKEKIKQFINGIKGKGVGSYSSNSKLSFDLKTRLSELMIYSEGILQLLNNFFVYEYDNVTSVDEVIESLSNTLAQEDMQYLLIKDALKSREDKGSTVLTGLNAILLHCKTKGVKELYFGAVRIESGLYLLNADEEKEEIKLAIIMIVPEDCEKAHIEAMSFISTKLIEEPEFLKGLVEDEKEEVYLKFNKILDEFYKLKNI